MQAYKYDVDFYSTSPKKLNDLPKQEKKFKVYINENYKRNRYVRLVKELKIKAIIAIALKTIILGGLIVSILNINAASAKILYEASFVQSEINNVKADIDYLSKNKYSGLSSSELRERAYMLGMAEPNINQIVYLMSNEDNLIIIQPTKIDELKENITNLFKKITY